MDYESEQTFLFPNINQKDSDKYINYGIISDKTKRDSLFYRANDFEDYEYENWK